MSELTREDSDWSMSDCFSDDSPNVAVGGVAISRATITSVASAPDQDAAEDGKPFEIHWHISGLAPTKVPSADGSERLVLVGDLVCRENDWFVGTTATCSLAFRDPAAFDPDDDDVFDAMTKTLGAWASNILYDTAAATARAMVAATPGCTMDVPITTPRPHITRRRRRPATEESRSAVDEGSDEQESVGAKAN